MSLIWDIEKGAIHGAVHEALGVFVKAGDTTDAAAVRMADTVVDVLDMMQKAAASKPQGNVVQDAVRGALEPFVEGHDITPAKADEAAVAATDALAMLGMIAKQPPQPEEP